MNTSTKCVTGSPSRVRATDNKFETTLNRWFDECDTGDDNLLNKYDDDINASDIDDDVIEDEEQVQQIRVFQMASKNKPLSHTELQKILQSEEFFEDLLIFDNNAELEDSVEEFSNLIHEPLAAEINCPPQENVDERISTIETVNICHSVLLVDNNHEFGLNNDSINSSQSEIVDNEEPNILNSHSNNSHATEKTTEDCESIRTIQDNDDSMPEGENSESLESDVEPLDYSKEKDLKKRNRKRREKGLQYKT
ncbi:hypothetical protein RN001_007305 [Aquatica leii]|uniref:Uncharacterized protein n=1 Tax=Aquatica leii TaxID=1421715 RepID=A0AAN7P8J1_9COLE|nr:hypothetical protein RN001_007305 [Aquatica leii]